MTQTVPDRMAELTAQESRFVFDSFDHADAWRLGTLMVERALREDAPIIIDIRRPGLVLFRSALAGTTEENEAWLNRKARTVFRFEMSTALMEARFAAQGVDLWTAGWFDTKRFTAAGGSFPVRVRGVGVVAAATVSGLTSNEDHGGRQSQRVRPGAGLAVLNIDRSHSGGLAHAHVESTCAA